MKTPTSFLFHLICISACFFLFSCSRAVDEGKTKITLFLPSANSVAKFSQDISQLGTSGPVLSPADTASNDTTTDALSPEFLAGASAPTDSSSYCYIVAIKYENDPVSSTSNANYCGKKSSESTAGSYTAGVGVSGEVSHEFTFSYDWMGLIDGSQQSVTASVGPIYLGQEHKFGVYILAVPSTSTKSCVDLTRNAFNKGSLYQPRIIGKQTGLVLSAGSSTDFFIPTDTTSGNPDATNYFDDCVISQEPIDFPKAETITINNDPFKNLRLPYATSASGTCQAVTVSLKAYDSNVLRNVPAAFDSDQRLQLLASVGGSTERAIDTYSTFVNCASRSRANDSFFIPRNQPNHTRWYLMDQTVSATFSLNTGFYSSAGWAGPATSSSATSQAITGNISGPTNLIFDIGVPRVLHKNTCYRAVGIVKEIGGVVSATGTATFTPAGALGVSYFDTDGACLAGTPTMTSVSTAGYPIKDFWIKIPSTAVDGSEVSLYGGLNLISASGTVQLEKSIVAPDDKYSFHGPSDYKDIDINSIGRMEAYTRLAIPNNGFCYPLLVNITNRKGEAFGVMPGTASDFKFTLADNNKENFSKVPLRYQQVQLASGEATDGYTLYKDDGLGTYCPVGINTKMETIGSSVLPTGTAATVNNGTFYKLYIRTNNDGKYGKRRILFYYGGSSGTTTVGYPAGHVDFELTTKDY